MNLIEIQVGQCKFTCTGSVLTTGSNYFDAHINRFQLSNPFHIDRDGEIFEHILNYLRTDTFPIFPHPVQGHDHVMYERLLHEAEYFGVDKLVAYLRERRYTQAFKVEHSSKVFGDVEANQIREVSDTSVKVEYLPTWDTRMVYVCPRGIAVHRGNPQACGQQCNRSRDRAGGELVYDKEKVLKVLEIKTTTIFDPKVMREQ